MDKDYTRFVKAVFTCITQEKAGDPKRAVRYFAENDISAPNQEQDSASLWDKDAELFLRFWKREAPKHWLDPNERSMVSWRNYKEYILFKGPEEIMSSRLDNNKHGKHLKHSCYPKNIRRWLAGTISRKKINRLDFCILAWCHTIEWKHSAFNTAEPYTQCQKKILEICNEYAGTAEKVLSLDLLWEASTKAYLKSVQKKFLQKK